MKAFRRIVLAVAGVAALSSTLHAQLTILRSVPQKISYQAVARDATGKIVPNRPIVVRFTILGGGPTGPVQYSETHETRTNQFGLFALQIGGGAPSVGSFADIPWTDGNQWVRVELDPNGGTNFLPAGEAELVSVPYALVANKALQMELGDITNINVTNAKPGDVLVFNGTNWVSTTLIDTAGNRGVLTTPRLTGNGLPGSPLDLAGQGARTGQVLKWNGVAWVPGNDSVGTGGGSGGGNYVAGNGISILGNTIAHTIWQDNGGTSTSYMNGGVGIGIGTPNASALLDLNSTNQGVLIPRMSTVQRNAIVQPATSLLIFNNTTNRFEYNAGTSSSPNWLPLGGSSTVNIANITGAGAGNNAASVAIPDGADTMVVSAPGLQAGGVVTVTVYDPADNGILAYVMRKTPSSGFTVRFAAPFPNASGNARLDYMIINP